MSFLHLLKDRFQIKMFEGRAGLFNASDNILIELGGNYINYAIIFIKKYTVFNTVVRG